MKHYAGLDVSLEQTSVCVVDESGSILCEGKTESDPAALTAWLGRVGHAITQVGLEAGPLSVWLHRGLLAQGYASVLMETREVKARLNSGRHKTDRADARGIAQILRVGWFRPVHAKSATAQDDRLVLTQRKFVQGQLRALENSLRGTLKGFGLKLGKVSVKGFAGRVRELAAGRELMVEVSEAMLAARETMLASFQRLDTLMRARARDPLCHRLMTCPGVGPQTALAFRATIDDPHRFKTSKQVGAHLGLTPRKYQSGETDRNGGISKQGDTLLRATLFEAAQALLMRVRRPSALQAWGRRLVRKRGRKRATVAVARRLAVILHRMWVDGSEFRWTAPAEAATAKAVTAKAATPKTVLSRRAQLAAV